MTPQPLTIEEIAFSEGVEAAEQGKERKVPFEFRELSDWWLKGFDVQTYNKKQREAETR